MAGLYNAMWQRCRLLFLGENPLCVYCLRQDRTTVADVVDHIVPHKGSTELFWDTDNWQSLCATCHNTVKAQEEGRIRLRFGCDENGQPLDPNHHWRK